MFSEIGEWSNDLANGMMTLEQEMAAFGEKMPEPKYRHGGKENERPDSDDDDYWMLQRLCVWVVFIFHVPRWTGETVYLPCFDTSETAMAPER